MRHEGTGRTDERPAQACLGSYKQRRVSVALRDGSRIDDAQLVSGGHGVRRLWVYADGRDVFVAPGDVVHVSHAA